MAAIESRFRLLVAILLGLVFGVGIVQLFLLRFAAGDVYPPYSSLRADPIGTRAFREALEELPGLAVERNHLPLNRFETGAEGSTLLLLGLDPHTPVYQVGTENFFTRFLTDGGRLAIALNPHAGDEHLERLGETPRDRAWDQFVDEELGDEATSGTERTESAAEDEATSTAERSLRDVSLREQFPELAQTTYIDLLHDWGVNIYLRDLDFDDALIYSVGEAELVADEPALPARLTLYSGEVFRLRKPGDWRVIYRRDGEPVTIERAFGKGKLVLSTDSYFVSNEALRHERHPALLTWLVGSSRRVIFDETHHGVRESSGVMKLARRFGLEGAVLGFLVLAGLFIWRASTSLVPPRSDDAAVPQRHGLTSGRDTRSGLLNLLRRNIPSSRLLGICYDHWAHAWLADRKRMEARGAAMAERLRQENAASPGQRDLVRAYRDLARILNRRR